MYAPKVTYDLVIFAELFFLNSGKPDVLSLVPKAKQIKLIEVLCKEGFTHYELLNANSTKAKGVGEDEFCLFLSSLGVKLPNKLVIIMDKAPIHQGELFE